MRAPAGGARVCDGPASSTSSHQVMRLRADSPLSLPLRAPRPRAHLPPDSGPHRALHVAAEHAALEMERAPFVDEHEADAVAFEVRLEQRQEAGAGGACAAADLLVIL